MRTGDSVMSGTLTVSQIIHIKILNSSCSSVQAAIKDRASTDRIGLVLLSCRYDVYERREVLKHDATKKKTQ